jgi:hypothetical protein
MFALYNQDDEPTVVYPHAELIRMLGGTPIPVTFVEDPEGDRVGFLSPGSPAPAMIQTKEVFDMVFPNGIADPEERSQFVTFRVERAQ